MHTFVHMKNSFVLLDEELVGFNRGGNYNPDTHSTPIDRVGFKANLPLYIYIYIRFFFKYFSHSKIVFGMGVKIEIKMS